MILKVIDYNIHFGVIYSPLGTGRVEVGQLKGVGEGVVNRPPPPIFLFLSLCANSA